MVSDKLLQYAKELLCCRAILSLDVETYSSVDISKAGMYRYTESPDFEILLLAYSYDFGPTKVIDLTREIIPAGLIADILNSSVCKTAFNAAFEIACFNQHFKSIGLSPVVAADNWFCTMVRVGSLGLPMGLDGVSGVLKLKNAKLKTGKDLIRLFCVPQKATKKLPERRIRPEDEPAKWEQFIEYNRMDVEAEKEVLLWSLRYPLHKPERELWYIDQRINSRGIKVDLEFVRNADKIAGEYKEHVIAEMAKLTGLANPNSGVQLCEWLGTDSVTKESVLDLLKTEKDPIRRRVLRLRQDANKTSTAKYGRMLMSVNSDQRIRGLFQFGGAARTGRWAGRLVQLQNLPQNHLEDPAGAVDVLDQARQIAKTGTADEAELMFTNVSDTLSQLIRTSFIPEEGKFFAVSDFSAIEARVLAWVAGEQWRLDVFRTHGKIYEASASAMFHVPLEQVDKDLRQKGKVAELALGYQGGPNALITMGALRKGLTEEELPPIVKAWRAASPAIQSFWWAINRAALDCVKHRKSVRVNEYIYFQWINGAMFINLPSGRKLCYLGAKLTENRFGGESVAFFGMNDKNKFGEIETYGGKLTENIVQAIARDCLAVTMLKAEAAGIPIVLHVHDEVAAETDDAGVLDRLYRIMAEPIEWAPGLPLKGAGFIAGYYKKD